MAGRVWLVTGCSSGFGRALAERVIETGDRLVATARRPETLVELVAAAPDRVIAAALDVTNPEQVRAAVALAIETFGQIDVLVNNAGYSQIGTIENTTDAEAHDQFAANFFGLFDVTRAVLPFMRKRRSGRIVNISSGAALGGRPLFGMYCASKSALEGAAEALALEVAPFGIAVSLVEPGAFATNLAIAARISAAEEDYAPMMSGLEAALASAAGLSDDPELVVDCIMHIVNSDQPPLRIMVGADCLEGGRERAEALARDYAASLELWSTLKAQRAKLG